MSRIPRNPQESMQKNVEKHNSSIVPMPSIQEQQVQKTQSKKEVSSTKRIHAPESSDSDKELPANVRKTQMSIVSSTPGANGWRKVEKKKGRREWNFINSLMNCFFILDFKIGRFTHAF